MSDEKHEARTEQSSVTERARAAAGEIAGHLFRKIFHPAGWGGISVDMENHFAAIITKHMNAATEGE